jgi:cytoskeleton protein RodZ
MTSIGDTLRRERLKRNLDLPTIAGELKITVRFLEAIEQNDFARLPGGVFAKSFVRQYAGFLGLDGEEMAAEVHKLLEPEPLPSELPGKDKPDVPGVEVEMGEDSWHSVRERHTSLPSWFKAGVLLVALMLVCSGVYWWFERPRRSVMAHETPPVPKPAPVVESAAPAKPVEVPPVGDASHAGSASAVPATTPPSAPAEAAVQPAAKPAGLEAESANSVPAAASQTPNPPPNPNATVRVAITAIEPVWVRADVNGKYQFSGTLQAKETRNIDADGQVSVRLGNAGGATITLNGKPVGEVGPKGQIRTVQFTSGGFQIVSAPKLLDPDDRL